MDTGTETTQSRILVVDDDPFNLTILGGLLHPHYHLAPALPGELAPQPPHSTPQPSIPLTFPSTPHLTVSCSLSAPFRSVCPSILFVNSPCMLT